MTIDSIASRINKLSHEWYPDLTKMERVKIHFRKLVEERKEFVDYPSPEEAADVVISCMAYLVACGADPAQVIEAKMQIIEARTDQVERDKARGIGSQE